MRTAWLNMQLTVNLPASPKTSYPIIIERGSLAHLSDWIDPKRRTILVHDSGIPECWVRLVKDQFDHAAEFCFEQGEKSKTLQTLEALLQAMSEANLNRKSQVIALGGGVTGDMAGFAAACYMRGIDFYNLPTTVLAQVDSSVGGKTAVDLGSLKNIVGAFWQPKAVIIDPDVLSTLDSRQYAAGLAEALKIGLCFDESLVEEFEADSMDLETVLFKAIDLKRRVVEADEKEAGLRKILNFGHTIGHAIEGSFENYEYLHGECVGAGMLYFIEDEALRRRVLNLEKRIGLPEIRGFDRDQVRELLRHDKKGNDAGIDCVFLSAPQHFAFRTLPAKEVDLLLERDVYEKHDR